MNDIIAKDIDCIPEGYYCYTSHGWNREEGFLEITCCPYFKHTDHGTVKCEFLGIESLSPAKGEQDDEERALAYEHFGSKEAAWKAVEDGGLLWDQIKECGENHGDVGYTYE